ncbi:MAG: flagellar biosynthesis protein FlhA [Nitrospirota bacterium]
MAAVLSKEKQGFQNADLVLSLGVVVILMVMVLPLPRLLVDLLLAFSFSISLLILFVSMYVLRPVDFSTFPSVLLFVTLYRLGLTIATTRLILLNGHEGLDAAGEVIKSFGGFVVGGNYAVGVIVFTILVVINFVVITKGAGRIAEVAARFMLDAMPGKQMSIDADLNAGTIDEKEARRRRQVISQEADFYGAMDGASKFVRGDAIASILMIVVNIIGGLTIGILQHGLPVAQAAQNYTLLTIGEGLVTQIPALLLSTAAGIVVSRAASESNLGAEISRQILLHPRAIMGAASIIILMGLIPGLPHFALLSLGGAFGYIGYVAEKAQKKEVQVALEEAAKPLKITEKVEGVIPLDLMELNVGYGLIPLVDERQGGDLLKRITALRNQLAMELGFVVPPVHIRDNLQLKQNEYLILIKGTDVARGELLSGHLLAMNPTGINSGTIPGVVTKEPCFGLPALWIDPADKEKAQMAGYTVVDLSSILATHITEVVRNHAHELLGRQETQVLLDQFKKDSPKVVEELVPTLLPLGAVVKVLGNLLRERVAIRDLRTILETLADMAIATKDPDTLTEYVRQALSRSITKQYQTPDRILPVIHIDPKLDQQIAATVHQTAQGSYLTLDPLIAQQVIVAVRQSVDRVTTRGASPVILCSPMTRPHLRKLLERAFPNLAILSSAEIVPQVQLQSLETVRIADAD